MAANDYHFVTTWRIPATPAEITDVQLARRHAGADPTVATAIPAPPGPTFPHNLRRRAS